jgi:hypothetical protein
VLLEPYCLLERASGAAGQDVAGDSVLLEETLTNSAWTTKVWFVAAADPDRL